MRRRANKQDILNLIYSTVPNYYVMDVDVIRNNGRYIFEPIETWIWNHEIKDLSIDELEEIYNICMNSHDRIRTI